MTLQTDHNGLFIRGMTDEEELKTYLRRKFAQEKIQAAYDRLLHEARARTAADGVSPLQGLWAALGQAFAAKSAALKCGRGCAHCCHTGVSVTQIEWEGIVNAARKKNIDLNAIIAGAAKSIDRVRQALKSEKNLETVNWHRLVINQPCPFLDEEQSCVIYEDRPLDCRLVVAFRGACTSKNLEHAQRGVWLEETAAATVIARLQHDKTPKFMRRKFKGTQPIRLLQHWLILWKEKNKKKRRT